jgi:multiple sugar transport system substrate-binding protein
MLKKVLISLFSIFLLCGCSSKKENELITFLSWGSNTEVKILKQIISDFEKENPNLKIDFQHIPQNYFQKLHLLFASKTAPDVIFINNINLPIYESYLEDLSLHINKNDFYSSSYKALSINNKILAIPRDISNLVVYVNLDLIDLPDKSWSLNDLLLLAQSAKTRHIHGIGCEEDIYWALPYLVYYGGGILDEDLKNIFYSEASQKGLKFYLDLINKYQVAPTKSKVGSLTLAQMFLNKKLAMYVSGRWMYPKISETANFNWSVINFPNSGKSQYIDASGWAISKTAKNKENSLKFVKYLSSEKSSKYFTKTGLIIPARKQVAELINNNEHNQKAFLEFIDQSTNTPINKNYKKVVDNINNKHFN